MDLLLPLFPVLPAPELAVHFGGYTFCCNSPSLPLLLCAAFIASSHRRSEDEREQR